jgi:hypothetical protein
MALKAEYIRGKYPTLKDILKALMNKEVGGMILVPSGSSYALRYAPNSYLKDIHRTEVIDGEKYGSVYNQYLEEYTVDYRIDSKRPAYDSPFIFDFLDVMNINFLEI